jgi:hypothetical protein
MIAPSGLSLNSIIPLAATLPGRTEPFGACATPAPARQIRVTWRPFYLKLRILLSGKPT